MPPLAANSSVVELRDASIAAAQDPETPVVENVNWFIYPSEYWVVGGLPGAGKSDLLATAAGLLKPLRGTHLLFGRDTFELSSDELVQERLRLGMVFADEGRLFRQMTVAENIGLPLSYHRNRSMDDLAEDIATVLEMTGLAELAHRPPQGINWNLRQRVALARALILKPEVLFLDEPLRGLDPRQVRWWLDFLQSLNRGHTFLEGRAVTLVIATNDLGVWADHAEQFGLINRQGWMFLGDRDELKACREPLLRELLVHDFAEV